MGLHDTFDFDEAAYRAKCAERPTPKLQEEEVKKLRQHFAASASMALGLSHAVQTAGLTLGVSAWGLRRYFIAKEKLAIIREELTKRGVPLHDMSKRDAAIPLGATAVGMGLGAGIGHLVGGAIAAPDVPVPIPGHSGGGAAMHLLQADPEAAAHGFAQGIAEQANAVGHAVHGTILGHGAEQVMHAAVTEGASGHTVGYAAGIMAAKKMEELLGECVGETVFAYAMEKLLDPEIKLELKLRGKCTRLQGPLGQYCRGCGESIRHGKFAHCCEESDDFDLCSKCREAGTSCACSDNQMLTMQKCVAGDVLVSEKGDARRRLATVSEIRCVACQRLITQGRYYYCPECSEDEQDVDMCQDCYRQGHTCRSPDTHRLYVYLRANSDGPHPDIATDGIGCKACKAKIKQGPFYFCGKCGDDFGICDRCYEMDKTCSNSDHVLTRYVVYKGEKQISKQFTEKDCCQFCKEQLGNGVFYCCSKCNDGCYDLCGKCYIGGAGCKDRTHSLLKCTPAGPAKQPKDYLKELFNENSKEQIRGFLNEKRSKISQNHK